MGEEKAEPIARDNINTHQQERQGNTASLWKKNGRSHHQSHYHHHHCLIRYKITCKIHYILPLFPPLLVRTSIMFSLFKYFSQKSSLPSRGPPKTLRPKTRRTAKQNCSLLIVMKNPSRSSAFNKFSSS